MEIGLSLGICRSGRVASFTPDDLTGLAATVLPAESLAAGLLWQDTAKTIAATADGDPVRVAVCPYTAVEFTAPSDAARPLLYEEGGGKWSLFYDGADDILHLGDVELLPGTLTLAASFVAASIPRYATLIAKAYNFSAYALSGYWPADNGKIGFAVNNPHSQAMSDSALGDSAWHSVIGVYDGAACTLYVDGVPQTQTVARTGTIADTSDFLGVGGTGSGALYGQFWAGQIAGVVLCASALDSTDRGSLNTYLAALTP